MIMKIKEMKTERLIQMLCIGYTKDTKKARETERKIIEELGKRGVVDAEYMKNLFEN